MNIYLRICQIKNKIRYNDISLDYFIECFKILNFLIYFEDYKEAHSFANTLKNAKVILETSKEEMQYLLYQAKLQEIDRDLESKLQVRNVKVR